MRDSHVGMPEILKAYERDGFYFGAVRIVVARAPGSRAGFCALTWAYSQIEWRHPVLN